MKLRESGMPEEAYWETLFDVPLILNRLGIDARLKNIVEFGCGYGTFTIPVARRISGMLMTFDIDEGMVERTRQRAAAAGAYNVVYVVRDVFADGFGGETGSKDACLLFNILHCEEPVRLLAEAARVVRPGGAVLVIHWRHDPATPRGPNLEIRPRPEQIAGLAKETGLLEAEGPVIDLPPWHYGLRLNRQGAPWQAGSESEMGDHGKHAKHLGLVFRSSIPRGSVERRGTHMSDADIPVNERQSGESVTSFYPEIIPPEEGHPTTANFEVVNTGEERGKGLRARVAFRRGERVARLSGVVVNCSSLDTIQISPTLHMHDRWFCRLLLHSCEPNVVIDTATMDAWAAKDIQAGDYLSIDYAATEDVLGGQFACHCGSPRCRGWMTGRREAPNEEGRAWLARNAVGLSRNR